MYADSHAHLTADFSKADLDLVLQRAKEKKIGRIVNICTDVESLKKGIVLKQRESFMEPLNKSLFQRSREILNQNVNLGNELTSLKVSELENSCSGSKDPRDLKNGLVQRFLIVNAAATPPQDVAKLGAIDLPVFTKYAEDGELVAIGETGLDYFHNQDIDLQKEYFIKYAELALKTNLALIIHCRNAFQDLFSLIKVEKAILHCFTGTMTEAEEGLKRGWFISFSGIITFKNAASLREVVKEIPLNRLLVETDSPFLAPEPYRGQINEPSFLPEIVKKIAEIKSLSEEQVARATYDNLKEVIGG